MKLGPMTIEFAEAKAPTGETGYSGGPAWGGSRSFGSETDYNTVWNTLSTRWNTVQKMLTDSDVAAALDAVVLPLLAAGLTVEPGEDTPEGRDAAAFIQNDLENMSLSLLDTRTAALYGCLSDGVAIFEKVWEVGDDKLIHLRKLGERPPRTVSSGGWLVDDNGGPKGIVQLDDKGTERTLDIGRLIMFIHRRRQGSLIGESMLRRVYGSWLMKTELMKVGSVAVARHAMGVPTMRPRSKLQEYLDKVDELLGGISTHERQFVRLDSDQEIGDFEIKGVQGAMADPVPQLEYHRRGIYLGMLCPFLPLGSDGVGSLALSETQSGFFLMLLQAIARLEEDTYNRYLIPQWCAWNWPGVSEGSLPRVAVGRLDRRNVAQWFEAVVQAVQSGAIVVGDELRAQAEDLLGIERADVEDEVQTGGVSPGETEPDDDNEASAPVKMAEAERPSAIAIRALGIEVKFDVLASTMDEREQRLVQKLTTLQRSQAKRLVAIGNKAVKAGDATVLESTVIETAREAEELLAEMGGAFDDAAEEYMRQIVSQGAKALKPVDKADRVALLAIVAAEYGRELGDRMRTAWGGEVARQLRTGADPGRLAAMTTGAPEKLLTALAGMALGAGMGEGRAATAEANKGIIEREIYTTMMDNEVCDVCDQYENQEYPVGEGPDAPNPDCLGTVDRCRCWRVPVIVRE